MSNLKSRPSFIFTNCLYLRSKQKLPRLRGGKSLARWEKKCVAVLSNTWKKMATCFLSLAWLTPYSGIIKKDPTILGLEGVCPSLTCRKADYNDASSNRKPRVPAPRTIPTIDDRIASERLAAHIVSRVLVCDSGFVIVQVYVSSMNLCRRILLLCEAESLSHGLELAFLARKAATSKVPGARRSGSRVNVRVMMVQISTFFHVVTV